MWLTSPRSSTVTFIASSEKVARSHATALSASDSRRSASRPGSKATSPFASTNGSPATASRASDSEYMLSVLANTWLSTTVTSRAGRSAAAASQRARVSSAR